MSFLTQSQQVFFGRPLPNSFNFPHSTTFDPVIIFSFNMSKSSQPIPFDHQTDWFPLFFLSFSLTTHIHLIIIISARFSFNLCSTFIGQVLLPCIRQLLTQIVYTLPFSFKENPFPVRMEFTKLFPSRSDSGCYCWIISSICIQHTS